MRVKLNWTEHTVSFEGLGFRTPQFKLMNKLLGKKIVPSAF